MADQDYLPSLATNEVSVYDIRTAAARIRTQAEVNRCVSNEGYSGFDPHSSHETFKPPPVESDSIPSMESEKVGYYDGVTAQQRTSRAASEASFRSGLSSYADYIASTGRSYTVPQRTVPQVSVTDDENPDRMSSNVVGAYDATLSGYSDYTGSFVDSSASRDDMFDYYMDRANTTFNTLGGDKNTDGSILNSADYVKRRYVSRYSRADPSITNRNAMSVQEAVNSDDATMRSTADTANSSIVSKYNTYATNISNTIYNPSTGEGMASRVAAGLKHATDESGQDLPTP